MILPMIILVATNLRLACLIRTHDHYRHNYHRIYTLLAIVFFFVFINIPGLGLFIWDMVNFQRIIACQEYNDEDVYFGYSTYNIFITEISNFLILIWLKFSANHAMFSANFLNVMNSSINFIFYVIFAPEFRRKLVRMAHNLNCLTDFDDDNYKSIFTVSNFCSILSHVHTKYWRVIICWCL